MNKARIIICLTLLTLAQTLKAEGDGQLWLMAGQSNMELPVRRVMDLFADEVNNYSNENITQTIIPKVFSFEPYDKEPIILQLETAPTASPTSVSEWSALGYFFAKAMYERTGVPQHVVNASWGGTPIEAWMSAEALADYPDALADHDLYADETYRERVKRLEGENFHRWNTTLWQHDPGMQSATRWYESAVSTADWTPCDPRLRTTPQCPGSHWFRKTITLDREIGGDATLRLGCLVDADSVWVYGVFVGNTTYMYPPRIYTIPAGTLHKGANSITVRVVANGNDVEFVPEKRYELILASGETLPLLDDGEQWLYKQGAAMPAAPQMMFWCYKPTVLYNAMIAPLQGQKFDGVVWYQGESNVPNRERYADYLKKMIADWRALFDDPTLPFYIVELADHLPYDDLAGRAAWAEMREQQAKAVAETANTYLIKNRDLGEWNDIHPLDKKSVAERVADAVTNN